MHGVYMFLMDRPRGFKKPDILQDVHAAWYGAYDHQMDENNWEEMIGVFIDGKFVANKEYVHGHFTGDTFKGATFKSLQGDAFRIIRNDLYWCEGLLKNNNLIKVISLNLVKKYQEIARKWRKKKGLDFYDGMRAATILEQLSNCAIPPFATSLDTPYDYTAFDLRKEESKTFDVKKHVVLIEDIHT